MRVTPVQPDDWTQEAAEAVAAEEGIVLTSAHWRVIWCWREVVARTGETPPFDDLFKTPCGIPASEIRKLFPGSTHELLSRIAGSPE